MNDSLTTDKNPDEWEVTAERFVGYIDIMGFKDLVARTSHIEIYEMMKQIEISNKIGQTAKWIDDQTNLIQITTYSDSIIIYSKENNYNSLYSIICAIASITGRLLEAGIPYKGAVAYGTMTLDTNRSIFFGQPLIDSYLLAEELSFYGIVVHASAEKKFDESGLLKKLLFLYNYLCPFKNGPSMHLTIYPMHTRLISSGYIKEHESIFLSIPNLRYMTSGALRKYIDSTEKYLNEIKALGPISLE